MLQISRSDGLVKVKKKGTVGRVGCASVCRLGRPMAAQVRVAVACSSAWALYAFRLIRLHVKVSRPVPAASLRPSGVGGKIGRSLRFRVVNSSSPVSSQVSESKKSGPGG